VTETPISPSLALARLGVFAILLGAIAIGMVMFGTERVGELINDAGSSQWGLVAFIVVYAIAVVLLLPGTIGTLSAGAVFGFPLGAFAAVAGATLGGTAAFFISRAMGREGAQHLLGDRLANIDKWIGRNDFASILILRLMPIVPFNGLNYASGLAAVRPSRYVAATALGLVPGSILTTAVGARANDPTSGAFLLLVGIMVVAVIASIVVSKKMTPKS